MNHTLYKKYVLSNFEMVRCNVEPWIVNDELMSLCDNPSRNQARRFCNEDQMTIDLQINHPDVLAGNAYWITHNELCMGYTLHPNNVIFRNIFLHSHQKKKDVLNNNISKNLSNFRRKIKSRTFVALFKINLPLEIIIYIMEF